MISARPDRGDDTVSVALCTYNGEKFIEEQLESILSQSILPTHIVVSDDGSTDGSVQLIRRVLAPARMKKLGITVNVMTRTSPLGVTANFESALNSSPGDLIALCDQDDVWHENHIETLMAAFDAPEVMLAHGDARLVNSEGAPRAHTLMQTLRVGRAELRDEQGPEGFVTLVRRNLVTGATAMVRRELVQAARPFPREWIHDHWLALVASLTGRVHFLPELTVDYRQHGANEIGVTRLTAGTAVDLLGQSRRTRQLDRVRRLEVLAERLDAGGLPCSASQRRFVADKLEHERRRLNFAATRWRRLPGVSRELFSGRYHRLSRGFIDVVRDALSRS